jgi:hypothetical protein
LLTRERAVFFKAALRELILHCPSLRVMPIEEKGQLQKQHQKKKQALHCVQDDIFEGDDIFGETPFGGNDIFEGVDVRGVV